MKNLKDQNKTNINKIKDVFNKNDKVKTHFQSSLKNILDLVNTNKSDDIIFIQIVNLQSHIDNFTN